MGDIKRTPISVILILTLWVTASSCGKRDEPLLPVSGKGSLRDQLQNADFEDSENLLGVGSEKRCKQNVKLSKDEQDLFGIDFESSNRNNNYIKNINNLIEETVKQSEFSNNQQFLQIVKAVAWKESSWHHYRYLKEDSNYEVLSGDQYPDCSWGIMQINQRYHGKHFFIADNMNYATNYLVKIYKKAKTITCKKGTNSGPNNSDALLRRVYAAYNAGENDICRNNHSFDSTFVKIFKSSPWSH